MTRRETSHDQLFKDLLRSFFDQLIELTAPALVQELDLEKVRFLEQEFFSDIPAGERTVADLVAEIPARKGDPKWVLLHCEIEGTFRHSTAERLWRYSMHLLLKHKAPAATIVLYLTGGPGGIREETLAQSIGSFKPHTFSYFSFGLANSRAAEFLEKPQELAWSLASLMNPGDWDRPRHKLACWQKLIHADVDHAKHFLLTNIVETYVKLDEREQITFDHYLADTEDREEIQTMQMTWAEELELKGLEKGRQEGRREGRQEGRREGRQEGVRMLLLQTLERRFGRLPQATLDTIKRLEESDRLQDVAARLLDAKSLDDLEF